MVGVQRASAFAVIVAALTMGWHAPTYADRGLLAAAGESDPLAQITLGPASADVGLSVTGFLGPASLNPVATPYPPSAPLPPGGFTPAGKGRQLFAGTLAGTSLTGQTMSLYSADLPATSLAGLGYDTVSWSTSQIPNLAYINRIINTYYPQSNLPSQVGQDPLKAAAVQAAIWYFSDGFVLNPAGVNGYLFGTVSKIVADTRANPLTTQPPVPQAVIDGPTSGAAGAVIGPFVVRGSAANVKVNVTNARVFTDPAGTKPLTVPASRPSGSTFFLRTTRPTSATMTASLTAAALAGTTVQYVAANRANPKPLTAPTLILAQSVPLDIAVTKTLTTGEHAAPSAVLAVTGISGTATQIGLATVIAGVMLVICARRRVSPGRNKLRSQASA